MTLWAVDLPDCGLPPQPAPVPPSVSIAEIEPEDAGAVAAAMGPEGDLVSVRLARGCRCYGAWLGERIVAYGWVSAAPEWIGEVGVNIEPAPGEAYVWNCVTLPGHRRQGLFRALLQTMAAELRLEGMARVWIGVVEGTAERAVADAGFIPILRVESRNLGWIRRLRLRAAEGAGSPLVRSARRVVRGRLVGRHSSGRRH